MKKLTALRLITSLIVAVCISALLVVVNKDGPHVILLKIFGIHLPVFVLFTLLAPIVGLAAVGYEFISKQKLISKTFAALIVALLVALNIELLSGISSSIVRAQDYAKQSEAASFVLGRTIAITMYLTVPPLFAGASQQMLSAYNSRIVVWVCLVGTALSSFWTCQTYLIRILQNVALLYFS
jgi:purine-cytosine permease-like protein